MGISQQLNKIGIFGEKILNQKNSSEIDDQKVMGADEKKERLIMEKLKAKIEAHKNCSGSNVKSTRVNTNRSAIVNNSEVSTSNNLSDKRQANSSDKNPNTSNSRSISNTRKSVHYCPINSSSTNTKNNYTSNKKAKQKNTENDIKNTRLNPDKKRRTRNFSPTNTSKNNSQSQKPTHIIQKSSSPIRQEKKRPHSYSHQNHRRSINSDIEMDMNSNNNTTTNYCAKSSTTKDTQSMRTEQYYNSTNNTFYLSWANKQLESEKKQPKPGSAHSRSFVDPNKLTTTPNSSSKKQLSSKYYFDQQQHYNSRISSRKNSMNKSTNIKCINKTQENIDTRKIGELSPTQNSPKYPNSSQYQNYVNSNKNRQNFVNDSLTLSQTIDQTIANAR